MNIKNFSFPVFSFQFNLNSTDGLANNNITPIMITSIDKIINIFINFYLLKTKTRFFLFSFFSIYLISFCTSFEYLRL